MHAAAAREAEARRGLCEDRVLLRSKRPSRPSASSNSPRFCCVATDRSNTKRSKLLALEMSIEGLDVSCVSAADAPGRCRCGRTRRAHRSRWWRPRACGSAGPSCAPHGRRRRCRNCRRHGEAHLLVVAARGLEVACEVIDDLRQQARPVDRVDRADLVLALEGRSFDTALTMSWQSSNTPAIAMLWMFASCRLNICACWNGLMRPSGEVMKTRTPFLPRIAYSAALPVSPLVAPRMLSSSRRRAVRTRTGCRATASPCP